MTKITIHWQKMQYHKKVAISVSLVQPTPYGTLTYTPAPWQPWLNSLPIWAQIVESNWDYLIKHNNVTIWEVEVSPASWYEFKNMVLWKNSWASITISTTPITLDDSDGITAILVSTMKQIQFYLWWDNQSYWDPWYYTRLSYNWQLLNPNVPYIEMQDNRNKVDLDITRGGLDGTFKFYESGTPSSADWLRAEITDSTYKISQIQYYDADAGTTYTCDWTSTIIWNVWDMWMARILLDRAQSCDLVDYQDAWLYDPTTPKSDIMNAVDSFIHNIWWEWLADAQFQEPNNGYFFYILYDWRNFCWLTYWTIIYYYIDQNAQRVATSIPGYIAFFYDGSVGTMYATPYVEYPAQYLNFPIWNDTGLIGPQWLINSTFNYWDKSALWNWITSWQCWDTCGLMQTIYNLATNK